MSPPSDTLRPTPRWQVGAEWMLTLGLAATVAWTTLCLGGYLAATMVVTSCAVFVLATIGVVAWASGRREFHLAVLLPVPFLLYALASVVWIAPAKWLAWREWLLWFQMWLVFALALHVGRGRGPARMLVGTLVILGLVGTSMAAYQRFVEPSWIMLGRTQSPQFIERSAGMFGIPNSLAVFFELIVPTCLMLLFGRTVAPGVKIVAGWLAALFLFAVVLTGSRGGWTALSLALLLWPLLGGGSWRRKAIGVAVVMVAAVAVVGGLYRYSEYARTRIDPILEGRVERSRPIMWKAAWQMWQDAPWLGHGAAAYNVIFDRYRPREFLDEPDWTHNDYLNTLSDYGAVGFGLWAGAGAAVLGLGWSAVRRARREGRHGGSDLFQHRRWRFGLWLGLVAYALHLGVDFHTKIPALAFVFAVVAALLVRDEPAWWRTARGVPAWSVAAVLVTVAIGAGWRLANPLYRAEALRFEARRTIDRYARTGVGDLRTIIPNAKANFVRAVRIYPENCQAWSDLAYATVQTWHASGGDLVTLGRFAELAADEALHRCPVVAEFWVRKGVALSIQRGRPEAESCFRRAVELSPNLAVWWLYYAYHLQAFPNRKADALAALETCLTLDPYYPGGESLRQQLLSRR